MSTIKKFITSLLIILACLPLCVGCSSLQPSSEQRAAAPAKPWTGAPEDPSYPLAESVAGLLNGIK
jgi:hypothetical protein